MTPGPADYDYGYDPIGNRTTSNVDNASPATSYTTNNLNQYTATANPSESFTHDADGNLTLDGTYGYTWDGENRLRSAEVSDPDEGDRKVVFDYDYMNRRIRKRVYDYDPVLTTWSPDPSQDLRFVYDQWNVVLVLDGLDENSVKTRYTWGLDLSGQRGSGVAPGVSPVVAGIHGAGGIGGLLAAEEVDTSTMSFSEEPPEYPNERWFLYDANGNVTDIVQHVEYNPLIAHYEYDAYGNAIVLSDADSSNYVNENPFRFSTKSFDTEVKLIAFPYRPYMPSVGRWHTRDPKGEAGGQHLYAYLRNNPVERVDPLGLDQLCGPGCHWIGFPGGCVCDGPPNPGPGPSPGPGPGPGGGGGGPGGGGMCPIAGATCLPAAPASGSGLLCDLCDAGSQVIKSVGSKAWSCCPVRGRAAGIVGAALLCLSIPGDNVRISPPPEPECDCTCTTPGGTEVHIGVIPIADCLWSHEPGLTCRCAGDENNN